MTKQPLSAIRGASGGFTLVEVLVTTALMAMVVGALATITSQWMPNWNRGIARLQRNEHLAVGLERLTADVAAAEFLSAGGETHKPFFDGTDHSVTFVRTTLGPNAKAGLEVVRIAETGSLGGSTVVRTRASFTPRSERNNSLQDETFTDPVVLLRSPYSLSISYSGSDRIWQPLWRHQALLPKAVRLTIRDAATQHPLSASTTVLLHSGLPVECIDAKSPADCLTILQPPAQNEKPRI